MPASAECAAPARAGAEAPPAPGAAAPGRRLRVLLGAHACEPNKGSEPGVGWESAVTLARHHEVWVVTDGRQHRAAIERELAARPVPNLHVAYYDLPRWVDALRRLIPYYGFNVTYYLWQVGAAALARRLHARVRFDVAQHLTYVRYWQPSFLWTLGVPFVWGPVGGADGTSAPFARGMSRRGRLEEAARDLMRRLGELDPFVRLTARRSAACVATTAATAARLRALGARHVEVATECALSAEDLDALARLRAPDAAPEAAPDPSADAAADAGPRAARFVSIGRLVHWKGYHLAVAAFASLSPDVRAEYWLVGDGPERARLEALVDRLGARGRVRFVGRVPRADVLGHLAGGDVMVHPSLHDSGGWACLEALAAGRPVLCLDAGGPGEQVTAECGVKIRPGDPAQVVADLAAAMRRLAGDAALRRQLGEAGRARVAAEYTWPVKVDRDCNRFARVLGARAS